MFQLAIMLARIALEPASELYKEDTAQSLLALIRSKPKSNVVPLFGAGALDGPSFGAPDAVVLTGPHDLASSAAVSGSTPPMPWTDEVLWQAPLGPLRSASLETPEPVGLP